MISEALPWVEPTDKIMDVIRHITKSQLGLAIVSTSEGPAIITDGDIRRAVQVHDDDLFSWWQPTS